MLGVSDGLLTHDEDEAWVHDSFEGTQQEAIGGHSGKVRTGWGRHQYDSPDYDRVYQ
jgi:hypothetical protein